MVADRLKAVVVEEPPQGAAVGEVGSSRLGGRHTAGGRVGGRATRVGSVLPVTGELDLLDPDVGEELEKLAPATG